MRYCASGHGSCTWSFYPIRIRAYHQDHQDVTLQYHMLSTSPDHTKHTSPLFHSVQPSLRFVFFSCNPIPGEEGQLYVGLQTTLDYSGFTFLVFFYFETVNYNHTDCHVHINFGLWKYFFLYMLHMLMAIKIFPTHTHTHTNSIIYIHAERVHNSTNHANSSETHHCCYVHDRGLWSSLRHH